MEGEYAAVEGARPYAFIRLAPSDRTSDVLWIARPQKVYLKDCPQRSVVFIHSSVRLVGSLRHSAARNAIASPCIRNRGSECPRATRSSLGATPRRVPAGKHGLCAHHFYALRLQPHPKPKHRVQELGQLLATQSSSLFDQRLLIAAPVYHPPPRPTRAL